MEVHQTIPCIYGNFLTWCLLQHEEPLDVKRGNGHCLQGPRPAICVSFGCGLPWPRIPIDEELGCSLTHRARRSRICFDGRTVSGARLTGLPLADILLSGDIAGDGDWQKAGDW